MRQITVTEEKKMKVPERIAAMPYEIVADGSVIGVVKSKEGDYQEGNVTCPNCKFVIALQKKDNTPAPFSIQHP